MGVDMNKLIKQIHDFPTLLEAKQFADELSKNDPDKWQYIALTVENSNKNVIHVYNDKGEFIGTW
jgi:hypothetical protein